MKSKLSREEILRHDEADLRRLGYAQQLFRQMGGFSNFAISFSIISVLTGAVLLYGYGLKFAGPVINTIGWPIASMLTLCIAASMAELASMYPTAGGLYYWAFRLGGRGWAWVTAWMNMIGQISVTAGVNAAAAMYLVAATYRVFGIPDGTPIPLLGKPTDWHTTVAVMAIIMVPQVLVNVFGVRLTARLNDFSVYWHILGVALIVGLLLFLGRHHHSLLDATRTATPLEASSADLGHGVTAPALVIGDFKFRSPLFALFPALSQLYGAAPFGVVFVLGLLQAQWTYTGYDASAHVAEETVMARLNSAWGVFLSVAISAVVGYVLLLALTWRIPAGKLAETANDAYPVLYIAAANLSQLAANVVAVVIGVAMWLCGLACISSMGRMWYAFARDGGMPGAAWLSQVHPRYQTPVWAIVVTSVLSVLLCLYSAAYSVVNAIGVITLYIAYVLPVLLHWRNRRGQSGEFATMSTAPWYLGRWGIVLNTVAVVYAAFLCVIFSVPPNELVLWTMLLLGGLLGVYWLVHARSHFAGPAVANSGDDSLVDG
jgi:amino acid transporter